MPRLTICAIIAVRNEYAYLKTLLPKLKEQKIDVFIIDNDSNDSSSQLFREYKNAPIIGIVRQPFRGHFSLSEQLEYKNKIKNKLSHDWLVHQDADEILENRSIGLDLRDTIEIADVLGYNCINFEEFVFLPEKNRDYTQEDYYAQMQYYYFHEPSKMRLQRAYKRTSELDNRRSAGHRLHGTSMICYPESQTLRHYIALSQQKADRKYLGRKFDHTDIKKHWHKKRMLITKENLNINPTIPLLHKLNDRARTLDRSEPMKHHFWMWQTNTPNPSLHSWPIETANFIQH